MMRSLFDKAFEQIKVVGFDLDGTIYDEFDFIIQVYREIMQRSRFPFEQFAEIYQFMIERWLDKGSSYPFIFEETQKRFGLEENFVDNALATFRDFQPDLNLPERTRYYLERIKHNGRKMFLLSDGRKKLQLAKVKSLDIEDFFDLILITENRPKPDPVYKEWLLEFFQCGQENIVYIGDREVDREFAANCGFVFRKISFFTSN